MDRHILPIIVCNALYLLAALVWALGHGNYEFLAYIVVVLLVATVLFSIHRWHPLPASLLWCLSAWGLMHMAGGLVIVPDVWPTAGDTKALYNLWLIGHVLKFDQFVHAWGFGITAWLCWDILRNMLAERGPAPAPTVGKLTLCVAASMGFGALNEVIEFTMTRLVPETNVGGYVNNSLDLVFNLIGALLVALVIRWRYSAA